MESNVEATKSPGWLRRAIIGRNPRVTLVRAAILAVLCILVANYILLPIRVEGISMMPTYQDNRFNLVNRLSYLFREPQRGDVVAIRLAGKHRMFMKRIVGLPGETVAFRQGRVLINGQELDEPYIKYSCNWEHEPEPIGPGEYYVVGDNRSMDFYDHEKGKAVRSRIMGKVML